VTPAACRGEKLQLVSICMLAGHFTPMADLAPVFTAWEHQLPVACSLFGHHLEQEMIGM
jgi:hypothetical protein